MVRISRLRLGRVAALCACLSLLVGCVSDATRGLGDASWEHQMRSGENAANSGRPAEAVAFYERAMRLALEQPLQSNRIADSSWHLAGVCFANPELCEPDEAKRRSVECFTIFAAVYGPEHPIVIPVLLRLSEIEGAAGDAAAATDLLQRADRITARAFPESHFMRTRLGTQRPAADLDPLELLRILAEMDTLDG